MTLTGIKMGAQLFQLQSDVQQTFQHQILQFQYNFKGKHNTRVR